MRESSRDRQSIGEALHHGAILLLLGLAVLLVGAVAWGPLSGGSELGPGLWPAALGAAAAMFGIVVIAERVRAWVHGEWRSTSLLPFRIALYLGVGSWLFVLALRQPPGPGEVEAVWGSIGALFPPLALSSERSGGRPARAWLRAVDALLFNLCAIVLVLELGLEVVARFSPSALFIRSNSSVREVIAQNRLTPGQIYFGSPVNSAGHHDREFLRREGVTVVAAIGDSFSIGVVPHFFHYTTVAERQLPGVQIFNLGVSGSDHRSICTCWRARRCRWVRTSCC